MKSKKAPQAVGRAESSPADHPAIPAAGVLAAPDLPGRAPTEEVAEALAIIADVRASLPQDSGTRHRLLIATALIRLGAKVGGRAYPFLAATIRQEGDPGVAAALRRALEALPRPAAPPAVTPGGGPA